MAENSILIWEDRLARVSLGFLALASAYGIVAGAVIAMYYDVTPGMSALEDDLGPVQLILFLFAVAAGLVHLPLAVSDVGRRLWKQAILRSVVYIAPLVVFLGAGGLVSHFLWWSPISDTGRYHMLHHSVFASAPLTFGFGLVLRLWWRPAKFTVSTVTRSTVVVSVVGAVAVLSVFSVLMGGIPPEIMGLIPVSALLTVFAVRRWSR